MAFTFPKAGAVVSALQSSFNADEVLTLHTAAKLLQVSEKTLWSEAKAGRVPHFRIGKQYRFVRSELLAWARKAQAEAQA